MNATTPSSATVTQPIHLPVMLREVIELLAPHAGGRYLDGTFGGGGHTQALLQASAPDGRVLAIDVDAAAIARGESLIASSAGRLLLRQGNFAALRRVAEEAGFVPLDGILLDLGLSSYQLADATRGFSFALDGPLDMRFDDRGGETAADLVNTLPETALADLIYRYGEERWSRRIARAIVAERASASINTTHHLAALVARAVPGSRADRGRIHPATRTFQALRIAVNRELAALEEALAGALALLAPGGRLVVIAFHSLEDRIVKDFMRRESTDCLCPPGTPVCRCGHIARLRLPVRKGVRATAGEVAANPRSRSAILRVGERMAGV